MTNEYGPSVRGVMANGLIGMAARKAAIGVSPFAAKRDVSSLKNVKLGA